MKKHGIESIVINWTPYEGTPGPPDWSDPPPAPEPTTQIQVTRAPAPRTIAPPVDQHEPMP